MKGTILLVVMVCFGFVTNFFKLESEKMKEGKMKRRDLVVLTALLVVLGMGVFGEAFSATPTITGISPKQGPAGTEVTISGTEFETGAKVKLGTDEAFDPSDIQPIQATEIKFVAPTGTDIGTTLAVAVINPRYASEPNGYASDCSVQEGCIYTYGIPEAERDALLDLYSTWSGDPGTECDGTWQGVTCNQERTHVTGIDLQGKGITAILSSIENLTELQVLKLPGNQIESVPTQLGSLSNLVDLDLSDNQLTSVPATLKDFLSSLALSLSGNDFNIAAPSSLTVSSYNEISVSLSWPQISDTGYDTVYEVYIKSPDDTNFVPYDPPQPRITCQPGGNCTATVNGLTQQTNYDFGVRAMVTYPDKTFAYSNEYAETAVTTKGIPRTERDALVTLFNNTDTNENDWINTDGWKENILYDDDQFSMPGTECSWYGVTCNEPTNDHVTRIDLAQNNLVGTIPDAIGDLTELTYLSLAGSEDGTEDDNELSGSIPSTIENLIKLTELNLSHNSLSGGIPSSIGSLTALITLHLEGNGLTNIPEEIQNLASLEYLHLENNGIAVISSALGSLGNLKELHLNDNSLRGGIPVELGNLENLTTLHLENNNGLGDSIPIELGDLDELQFLYLNNSGLTGSIPAWEAGKLSSLTHLFLNDNYLSGSIPPEISNLSNLQHLNLENNMLEGEISTKIILLTNLVNTSDGGESSFRYNAIFTENSSVNDFMADKDGTSWKDYQTTTPSGLSVSLTATTSISLTWTKIDGDFGTGRYEIYYSTNPFIDTDSFQYPPTDPDCSLEESSCYKCEITADKKTASATVNGLLPETIYYFWVRTVTNPGEMNEVSSGFTKINEKTLPPIPPKIIRIDPTHGPSELVTEVVITGENFDAEATVEFDGAEIEADKIEVTPPNMIVCETPLHVSGEIVLTVINPGESPIEKRSDSTYYIYDPPPEIKSISPGSGSEIGGDEITIAGSDFKDDDPANPLTVTFGGKPAEIKTVSFNQIICECPKYPVASGSVQVDVVVTNSDGQSDTDYKGYIYDHAPKPTVTDVKRFENGEEKDSSGTSKGGDTIKIKGDNFVSDIAKGGTTQIFFGDIADNYECKDVRVNEGSLTCTTPEHKAGTVDVTAVNPDGQESEKPCTQCFTFSRPPEITQIKPNYGPASDEKTITITGSDFVSDDSNPLTVTFDGESAHVNIVESGSITCKCPSYKNPLITEDVPVQVVVTNSDGQSDIYESYTYTTVPPPIVSSVTPSEGPVTGGISVTITGANFIVGADDKTEVTFGGASVDILMVVSSTEISCRTPEFYTETAVNVVVTNPDGQKSEPKKIYDYRATKIKISPTEGPSSGETELIVTAEEGVSFENVVSVTIGGILLTDFDYDSDKISFATPPHKAEAVDVTVIANGKPLSCIGCYTYTSIPSWERAALIDLYDSTKGDSWKDNTNWKYPAGTECTWKGVKCGDDNKHVIGIDLDYNKLVGTIPSSIEDLAELQYLKVRGNLLGDDFPISMIKLNMEEDESDFCQNYDLGTSNETLKALLTKWQKDDDWESCQTCNIVTGPILISPTTLNMDEQDEPAIVTFRLESEPTAEVVIELLSANIGECNVDKSSVTLNSSNWDDNVRVNVSSENDGVPDGDQTCTILTRKAVSDDNRYNGIDPADITVVVYDDSEELTISSVYPAFGPENEDLNVTIQGSSFDSDTDFFLIPQDEKGNPAGPEIEITPEEMNSETEVFLTIPGQPKGLYGLKVSKGRETDELIGAVSFLNTDDIDQQKRRKAIIVGGTRGEDDILMPAILTVTKKAYHSLISQDYTAETIQYLIWENVIDITGDGNNDRDGEASLTELENAITVWAADLTEVDDELLIYIVDHGGDGYATLNSGDELKTEKLDEWLDELQQTMKGRIVIVYDACKSGSFISSDLSGENRIILTSASSDESAWFLDNGEFSFSYHFWDSVYYSGRLYWSFVAAREMMKVDQKSLADSDGDGLTNDVERDSDEIGKIRIDDNTVDDIKIGRGRMAGDSVIPEIGSVCEDQTLEEGETSAELWAKDIVPENRTYDVWAVIISPDDSSDPNDPVIALPSAGLRDFDSDKRYDGTYRAFTEQGLYRVCVYAKEGDNQSLPVETQVTVVPGDCSQGGKGDVDENGTVGMKDAITALKIAADGTDVEASVCIDVDGDRYVGLAEAIYILKLLSGCRP